MKSNLLVDLLNLEKYFFHFSNKLMVLLQYTKEKEKKSQKQDAYYQVTERARLHAGEHVPTFGQNKTYLISC